MSRGLSIFSKGVVFLMGLAGLAVCFILLPELAREEAVAHPDADRLTWPFLATAYVLAIPFFVALYHTFKLLTYVDKNQAFSSRSVKALKNIKICAIVFGALIALAAITMLGIARVIDPTEDVTHIAILGFIFTFTSGVIAVFTAVLQRLLTDALAMKSENDLTV